MVKDKYWISETKGEYWDVMFGDKKFNYVMSCRAKSRSKAEMKYLLDHFNAKITQAKIDLKRERHNAKYEQSNEEVSSVSVLWGSDPDDVPVTYYFDTQAEMEAFLHGVDEAFGWMDYAAIRHSDGPHQKFNPEDFDLDPSEMRKELAEEWKKYIARETEVDYLFVSTEEEKA